MKRKRKPSPERLRRWGDNLFLSIVATWIVVGCAVFTNWLMRHK